jgi:cell division septation protein DedD
LTCAWAKSYWHLRGFPTSEIEYATIAPAGAGVSLSKLTTQDRTPFPILDISPTLAIASNGNIAFAWTRQYPHWQPGPVDCAVENVAYAVVSGSGQVVKSPNVLTGNGQEYCPTQPRVSTARDLAPVVAATDDDRFFVAWQRQAYDGGFFNDVYYAVLDVNGNPLLPPTALVTDTNGATGTGYLNARLFSLAGARMLVLWDDTHNLSFAVLSSAGAVVRGPEALNTGGSNNGRADAAISSNGDVLIAWIQDNMVAYTILNAALQSVRPATRLNDPLSQASDAVSAAITAQGQWVLTWHDDAGSALHYALLASAGQILTPPMPFHQAHEDWIAVNRQGYGLVPTDFTYVAPAPTPTPAGLAPRTVLAELFSISVESLCAGPQGALSRLVDAYGPSQLAALQYFPSSDDLGSPAADLRAYLYRVFRSPLLVWDGAQILSTGSADPHDARIQKQYRGIIEFERAQPSRLTLSLEASFTQNRTAIGWTATVHPLTDAIGSNLLFDCFVYEDPVTYALQDRTATARFIVRDLSLERPLNLTTQETQVVTGSVSLQPGWTREHLGLIALVQDRTSYQVLQSVVKPMVAQATPTPTPAGASHVVTLQQGLNGYTGTSDTYLSSGEPNRNFESPPGPPRLQVKGDGSCASLIRFDLPEELRGRTIVSATLQLLTRYRANSISCSVGAYRVHRAWLADQATWVNATRTQAWGFPGIWPVDSDQTPLDQVQLSSDDAWYDLDVTQAVRDWTADSASNDGLLLRSTVINAATYHFSSSEDNVQAFHPRLVIVWGEPEVTPQATATPITPTPTSTPSIVEITLQQGLNAYTGTSDTYISSSESNRNFESPPGPPRLQVKGDGTCASLIRFDLPEELRGRTIVSATLQLLTRYRANSMSCSVGAYRVHRAWLADQATWVNATRTQAWGFPGIWPVDSDQTPLDQVQLSSDNAWYDLDVTQAVREWTPDWENNYGLLLRSASANAATYQFASSDDNVAMFHPKLVIVYDRSIGTPAPTATPTATSTPTRTRSPTPTRGPTRTQTPLPLQWTLQQGRAGYAGTQDTYIAAAGPDTNYSHEQRLLVKGDGLLDPLIRFELPPDLRGYAIIDATLELFARGRDKVVPCVVAVYRMRRTWHAGEATWLRATTREGWNRPGLGPGLDYDSAPLNEVQLSSANDWYAWHITQAVRDWIADPSSNYGLCLRSGSSGAVTYELASSEHYQQDSRPRLVILYGEPTATPTATVTSTPMPTATQTASPTTPSPSPSATQRPSPTVTATASPTTTQTASPSPSVTPEATATPAPSRTPTRTPTTASWIVHLPIVIKEHSLGSQPDAWRRVGPHFWTFR